MHARRIAYQKARNVRNVSKARESKRLRIRDKNKKHKYKNETATEKTSRKEVQMGEIGFDADKYIEEQSKYILERINAGSGKRL